VRGVSLSQARRHEALDRLSEEGIRRPAELLLDLRACVHDPTAIVDGNDRIGAGVENWRGAEPKRCADPGSSCPRRVHTLATVSSGLSRIVDPGVIAQGQDGPRAIDSRLRSGDSTTSEEAELAR
jgi:hypothetical protein